MKGVQGYSKKNINRNYPILKDTNSMCTVIIKIRKILIS